MLKFGRLLSGQTIFGRWKVWSVKSVVVDLQIAHVFSAQILTDKVHLIVI